MPSNVLASGTATRLSNPIDVTSAAPATLVGRIGPTHVGRFWRVDILIVNADGSLSKVGTLTQDQPSTQLTAVGSYRLSVDAGVDCIVDRN